MKNLLATITILVDTREQANTHITSYFNDKGIPYKQQKLSYGDYSAYLPANEQLGIPRGLYFPTAIERKNSIDELASSIKDRTRFENELIRAHRSRFMLMVEDANGYHSLVTGAYRSQYQPKSLLASLKAFEARYGFQTVFVAPQTAGNYIYHHFYYLVREMVRLEV